MKTRTIALEQSANLDSFLDIITNVIGVLILIACAIVMQVQNFKPPKKAPIMESCPAGKDLAFFDCSKMRCEKLESPRENYDRMMDEARANFAANEFTWDNVVDCLLYTSPSPRD